MCDGVYLQRTIVVFERGGGFRGQRETREDIPEPVCNSNDNILGSLIISTI